MTGVPAPAEPTVWRLPGSVGRPCVNVHRHEARGHHRLDTKTTLPPAPRRVLVDVQRSSGWFTDPDHLETLGRALVAAAEWLRATPDLEPVPEPQLSLLDELTEEVPCG